MVVLDSLFDYFRFIALPPRRLRPFPDSLVGYLELQRYELQLRVCKHFGQVFSLNQRCRIAIEHNPVTQVGGLQSLPQEAADGWVITHFCQRDSLPSQLVELDRVVPNELLDRNTWNSVSIDDLLRESSFPTERWSDQNYERLGWSGRRRGIRRLR